MRACRNLHRRTDACTEAKVDHVVYSSVANCDCSGAPSYHQSKYKIEERLKRSGLSHTILRPVSFLEVWARLAQFSNVSISGLVKGHVKQQWVCLDDVGAAAALVLQQVQQPCAISLVRAGRAASWRGSKLM